MSEFNCRFRYIELKVPKLVNLTKIQPTKEDLKTRIASPQKPSFDWWHRLLRHNFAGCFAEPSTVHPLIMGVRV